MDTQWSRIFKGLTFKVADDNERVQALRRRSEIYELELGHHGTDEFDATAAHLVAINESGLVVSAMRVILQRPLEIERHLDLSAIVEQNKRVSQIGGFWVEDQWRVVEQHRFLQIGMLKLAYMFGGANDIGQFVMYTYPRLVQFYRGAFFEDLCRRFAHPAWGDVSVLRLDLCGLAERCRASTTAVARLLTLEDPENFAV